MSPDFSQRYDSSMSTSFSYKLRGNCPCILMPCHLSFVFSAMLSIFLDSFCTSVFRHLAVCNNVESVLCWCVLTTCISGSYQMFSGNQSKLYLSSCFFSFSPHILPSISLIDPCNLYFQGDILFALLVVSSALPNVWRFIWLLFLLGFCTWSLSM